MIHNAPFDVGFLDHELNKLDQPSRAIAEYCTVLDTLVMARQKHPGQKNSLDALCKRYDIDNSQRSLHGALLDARILADVYLVMTGGQTDLSLDELDAGGDSAEIITSYQSIDRNGPLPVWKGDESSEQAHRDYLTFLQQQCEEPAWK